MNQDQLAEVYEMLDSVPFSRVKTKVSRDFSDGVMMAELIMHYQPKLVSLHSYPPANSTRKKIENWNTLNLKVFKKIGINLSKQHIQEIVNCTPYAIQRLLYHILIKFQKPQDEARLSQHTRSRTPIKQNGMNQPNSFNKSVTPPKNRNQNNEIGPGQGNDRGRNNRDMDGQEILELVEKIDQANSQLEKLMEINRLKEDEIKNLQKKLEKIIFN